MYIFSLKNKCLIFFLSISKEKKTVNQSDCFKLLSIVRYWAPKKKLNMFVKTRECLTACCASLFFCC